MSDIGNDMDSFWDIDKLVPKKKTTSNPFVSASAVREHNLADGDVSSVSKSDTKLTFSSMRTSGKEEITEYAPEGDGLIRRVTLKRYIDKFDFYGNFRKTALIYYDYKTQKCDFTPFYSYMPQYTQLNAQQKAYYFYWRDEIRRGKYIKCDYSYLYLYVYEILNLPDKIEPTKGIKLLTGLWREYRKSLPRIDAYMSVWVQDYCFVHNLSCPMDDIRDFVFDVISGADFKEFYLSDITGAGADGTEAMIAYLSDYDWRRSKYAVGENEQIFRNHMIGSLRAFLDRYNTSARLKSTEPQILRRDAFPHSLCTHAVKCKLEIEYIPLSKDDSMRAGVTAAVRYSENKLRALLGTKSRLGIKGLPDEARFIIDKYFDNIFEIERKRRERECAPEYERLYDAEDKHLSFADADEIERVSWTTTARLVAESDSADDEGNSNGTLAEDTPDSEATCSQPFENSNTANSPQIPSESAIADVERTCDTYGLSEKDVSQIAALISDEGESISDDAFERINEAFLSSPLGDIILEHDGERYVIIEDYREDVGSWLEKIGRI